VQSELATGLPHAEGDRVQLQQVILNAVDAMRGIDEGARELRISTDLDAAGGVLVTVRDSDPGLDPQSADHLVEGLLHNQA
jgi:C4-dicarboxylate-specific signal transduction histidine kinase